MVAQIHILTMKILLKNWFAKKAPYPDNLAVEFARGEQADVWIEGMGWCVGAIVKLETDRVCFHVNNKGSVWKEKNSEHLAPISTQTHYFDLRRLEKSQQNHPLVPYVPSADLSSNSVPSTVSSSTPFVSSTTTITTPAPSTSTPTHTSGEMENTLGVVPKISQPENSSPPVTQKGEKKINIDNQNSESISVSNNSSNSSGSKESNQSKSMSVPSITSTPSTGSGSTQSEGSGPPSEEATWECLGCTFKNLDRAANCVMCHSMRYQDEV